MSTRTLNSLLSSLATTAIIASAGALSGCAPSAEPPAAAYDDSSPPAYVDASASYEAPEGGIVIAATDDFYQPLQAYGTWADIDGYGRCWRPTGVAGDWRPYTDGQWVATDSGWYWESDEPWGWATCHYGRWNQDPTYGWYWVPQVTWAPAWVAWREGGGYCGWAPLPPSGVSVSVSAGAFVFVDERHFSERIQPSTVIVNNTTIINKTVVINNNRTVNRATFNAGPKVADIEKATGRSVRQTPVAQVRVSEEKKVKVRPAPVATHGQPAHGGTAQAPESRPENRTEPEKPGDSRSQGTAQSQAESKDQANARAQEESKAKAAAEAKAEEKAQASAAAEKKAQAEELGKAKASTEVSREKATAESEKEKANGQAKVSAEAQAKAGAEAKEKAESEAKAKAQAEERAKKEQEDQGKPQQ